MPKKLKYENYQAKSYFNLILSIMQAYKTLNISSYDNQGNCYDQTRYEILGGKRKFYVCGYDHIISSHRHLDIDVSYDMNNFKKLLTYFENKNVGKYVYHYNKDVNQEIYDLIRKTFNLRKEFDIEDNKNSICVIQ